MIIREIHTFFRNDLCVIYTDFHGCGLKLLLSLDEHLFVIFFFPICFFFHVFFAVNPTMNSVERVIWNHYNMVRKVICYI